MTTTHQAVRTDGFKLSDEVEQKIEELVDSELVKKLAKSADLGRARRIDDGQGRYVEFAKRTLPRNLSLDGLRVVVDCANGAAYKVAPQALWELGAESFPWGRARRLQHQSRMRLDRDRAALPEGEGNARRYWHRARRRRRPRAHRRRARPYCRWRSAARGDRGELESGRPPRQARHCRDVMSNLGLERYLEKLGISLARTPVGDRYVLEHMRAHGFNVGGESSGHIILSDYTTTGDGLLTPCSPGGGQKTGAAGVERLPSFDPLRKCSRTCAIGAASRSRTPRCATPSRTRRPASMAMGG